MTNNHMQDELIDQRESVPIELDGKRFDQVAAQLFPQFSRARLQAWIKEGDLTCDGQILRPKDKLEFGQMLVLQVQLERQGEWLAEEIALDIEFEDQQIIVLNKPAGLVVHPAAGHQCGTLLNALLHHSPGARNIPRAGIVHRLDKDTSGLMVVAKTLEAHNDLVNQLQERTVSRHYCAVVQGVMTGGGLVEADIGRHQKHRQKMAVVEFGGKYALTHYRLVKKFHAHSLIHCQLETGRTHQIRVHMAHINYALLGDPLYCGRAKIPKSASLELINTIREFDRQALHAFKLGLRHPGSGEYVEWEIDLPEDMQVLLAALEGDVNLRGKFNGKR